MDQESILESRLDAQSQKLDHLASQIHDLTQSAYSMVETLKLLMEKMMKHQGTHKNSDVGINRCIDEENLLVFDRKIQSMLNSNKDQLRLTNLVESTKLMGEGEHVVASSNGTGYVKMNTDVVMKSELLIEPKIPTQPENGAGPKRVIELGKPNRSITVSKQSPLPNYLSHELIVTPKLLLPHGLMTPETYFIGYCCEVSGFWSAYKLFDESLRSNWSGKTWLIIFCGAWYAEWGVCGAWYAEWGRKPSKPPDYVDFFSTSLRLHDHESPIRPKLPDYNHDSVVMKPHRLVGHPRLLITEIRTYLNQNEKLISTMQKKTNGAVNITVWVKTETKYHKFMFGGISLVVRQNYEGYYKDWVQSIINVVKRDSCMQYVAMVHVLATRTEAKGVVHELIKFGGITYGNADFSGGVTVGDCGNYNSGGVTVGDGIIETGSMEHSWSSLCIYGSPTANGESFREIIRMQDVNPNPETSPGDRSTEFYVIQYSKMARQMIVKARDVDRAEITTPVVSVLVPGLTADVNGKDMTSFNLIEIVDNLIKSVLLDNGGTLVTSMGGDILPVILECFPSVVIPIVQKTSIINIVLRLIPFSFGSQGLCDSCEMLAKLPLSICEHKDVSCTFVIVVLEPTPQLLRKGAEIVLILGPLNSCIQYVLDNFYSYRELRDAITQVYLYHVIDGGNKLASKTMQYKLVINRKTKICKPDGLWTFLVRHPRPTPEMQSESAYTSNVTGVTKSIEIQQFELLRSELIELERRDERRVKGSENKEDFKMFEHFVNYSKDAKGVRWVKVQQKEDIIARFISEFKGNTMAELQGTQLISKDFSAPIGLLARVSTGDELTDKDKPGLRGTLTDLASVISIGIAMLFYVTVIAVRHTVVLAAIQNCVESLIPSMYGSEGLDLLGKLEDDGNLYELNGDWVWQRLSKRQQGAIDVATRTSWNAFAFHPYFLIFRLEDKPILHEGGIDREYAMNLVLGQQPIGPRVFQSKEQIYIAVAEGKGGIEVYFPVLGFRLESLGRKIVDLL